MTKFNYPNIYQNKQKNKKGKNPESESGGHNVGTMSDHRLSKVYFSSLKFHYVPEKMKKQKQLNMEGSGYPGLPG